MIWVKNRDTPSGFSNNLLQIYSPSTPSELASRERRGELNHPNSDKPKPKRFKTFVHGFDGFHEFCVGQEHVEHFLNHGVTETRRKTKEKLRDSASPW